MELINRIKNSGFFSGQKGMFWIGIVVIIILLIGIANRAKTQGTGRYAGMFESFYHLGDWSKWPLSFYGFILTTLGGAILALGAGYYSWGPSFIQDQDRMIITLGLSFIGSLVAYWLAFEIFFVRKSKNRFVLGERFFGFPLLLSLSEKDRYEHILIEGRAGTGKTTGFMFPQLLDDAEGDCSAVLLDVKSPEGFETVAGAWSKRGKKVIVFDPFQANCIGFEPLRNTDSDGLEAIEETVFGKRNTDEKEQTVWFEDQERRLFRFCCELVMGYKNPSQCSLPMVHQLLIRGGTELQGAISYCNNTQLQKKFEPLFDNKNRLQDLIGGVLNKLDLFSSKEIAAAFSRPDLDVGLLFREPCLLIIASPHSNPKARLAASILLRAIMMEVYKNPVRAMGDGPSLFFYLDEVYALHLPDWADFANTARSARVGLVTGLQTEEQLRRYQPHERATIKINTKTKIYLQGCDFRTCEELSKRLGKRSVRDKRYSRSMQRGSMVSTGFVEVPLETPDSIENLPLDEALIFVGGLRGFKAKRVTSYKTRQYKKRLNLTAQAYRPTIEPLVSPSYKDMEYELPPGVQYPDHATTEKKQSDTGIITYE